MISTLKQLSGNIFFLTAAFLILFSSATYVYAATHSMTGGPSGAWSWSSTIGFIDMSAVQYDDATNAIRGYAWSENIGWIRFANWADCPASAVGGCDSRLDPNTGEILGWARACAGATNNLSGCPTAAGQQNPDSGGWDGWISLSCRNESASCDPRAANEYGWVVSTNGDITGFAWGGGGDNQVVGWVTPTGGLNIGTSIVVAPVVTLELFVNGSLETTNPALVPYNAALELRWSINTSDPSNDCSASSFTVTNAPAGNGTTAVLPPSPGTSQTHTFDCLNSAGAGTPVSITVTVPNRPVVTLTPELNGSVTTDNPIIIGAGDTLLMDWDTTIDAGDTATCNAVSGTGFDTGTNPSGRDPVTPPVIGTEQTYMVTCTSLGGTTQASVVAQYPVPQVNVWASQTLVNTGDSVDISWEIIGRTPSSCQLTGPNGLAMTLTTETGSVTDQEINGESNFELVCASESALIDADDDLERVQVVGVGTEN